MKEPISKEVMAMRAARELKDGDVVNLGTGIPMLVRNYILPGVEVIFHTENGAVNFGRLLTQEEEHLKQPCYTSAGGQYFLPMAGTSFVDHCLSFVIIRGGRLDVTILGGLEVSEKGDLANWTWDIQGRTGGIGGSMDLVIGARKVVVLMTHVTREGKPKLVRKCALPLTGIRCVDTLITDLGVFDFTDQGVMVREVAPGWTLAEVEKLTEAPLVPDPNLKEMEL